MVDLQPAATAASFATHVLKDGDSFVVANAYGDIEGGSDGLFHDDTRLLSTYSLRIAGLQPEALSASVSHDNVFFVAHLTNRPLPVLGAPDAVSGLVHIVRTRFLCEDRLYERIRCHNYGHRGVIAPLHLRLGANFRDMFEVRGSVRAARGTLLPVETRDHAVVFGYEGLDGRHRSSAVVFSREPSVRSANSVEFILNLPPNTGDEIFVEVGLSVQDVPSRSRYRSAAARAR